MKIDINELRVLIEKRKELKCRLNGEEDVNTVEILQQQLKEIDKKIAPESTDIENDLRKFFRVPEKILDKKLVEFFKQKEGFTEGHLPISLKKVHIKIREKLYILWDLDDFIGMSNYVNLTHLYSDFKNYSWNEIMKEYPEIIEVLWDALNEKQNFEKFNKATLIKKMINEKKSELDVLTNPKTLKKRIVEISSEIKQDQNELQELEATLYQVEI